MKSQEAFQAERAAIQAYETQRSRGRRVRVMGIDVTDYAGARTPGLDSTKMFSDPRSILKHPKDGADYCWRDPADAYSRSLCARQVLRPVTMDEIDLESPFANVDPVKIITAKGPRQVVRSPGGLGLFEIPNAAAQSDLNKSYLPGSHWEKRYLSELAEQDDKFSADVEQLNSTSRDGHIEGSMTTKDTRAEMIL